MISYFGPKGRQLILDIMINGHVIGLKLGSLAADSDSGSIFDD
jgi:hypothetical protein